MSLPPSYPHVSHIPRYDSCLRDSRIRISTALTRQYTNLTINKMINNRLQGRKTIINQLTTLHQRRHHLDVKLRHASDLHTTNKPTMLVSQSAVSRYSSVVALWDPQKRACCA